MLDRFFAEKLAGEVNNLYKGERIKIISYDRYNLRMIFNSGKPNLILSAHPLFNGIMQEFKSKNMPGMIGNWTDLTIFNDAIKGLTIKNVRCSDKDRIIFFDINDNIQIVCHLFGRNSNIIITEKDRIKWSLNKRRDIGKVYEEPKRVELPSVYDIGVEGIIRIIRVYKSIILYKAISSSIREITPDTARFLIEYICLPPQINIDDISDDNIKELSKTIYDYCNSYNNEEIAFRVLRGYSGNLYISPLQSPNCMKEVNSEDKSPLRLLRKYNELLYTYTERQLLERQALLKISKRMKKLEEKIKYAKERLREFKSFHDLRHKGDIIMSNLHILEKGRGSVVLPNGSGEGNVIEIELDPSLTPYENAVIYYKKAKKMERSLNKIPVEIKKLKSELEKLPDPDYLSELTDEKLKEIISQRVIARVVEAKPRKKAREFLGLHILKVDVRLGVVVYIGRDARSNEYVTFRLAKGNDLWFHAFERHGSHIILKLQKGREPTGDDIMKSAKLSAYFSKGRSDSKVDVVYTKAKYVKKTKIIDKVIYSNNKSIIVKPASIEELGLNVDRL